MNKKKILHIMPSLEIGGVEKGIVDAFLKMDSARYQFDFLVERDLDTPLSQMVKHHGGNIYEVGKFKTLPVFAFKFLKRLAQGKYDAVHAHTYFFSGCIVMLAFLARVGVRVSHIHSNRRGEFSCFLSGFYRLFLKFLIKHFSTKIVAVSSAAANALAGDKILQKPELYVQPMGVDFSVYEQPLKPISGLAIEDNSRCLIHLGRFSKEKNHSFILKLFVSLKERGQVDKLVLIGDGAEKARIVALCEEFKVEEDVVFLGIRTDCADILRTLNGVFVFPSHFEGFGLAAVEAQAAGLPVLASDNVPRSVSVMDERIKFLSLEEPLDVWAQAYDDLLALEPADPDALKEKLDQNPANMKAFVSFLEGLYA